jgi:hypothetical protein
VFVKLNKNYNEQIDQFSTPLRRFPLTEVVQCSERAKRSPILHWSIPDYPRIGN